VKIRRDRHLAGRICFLVLGVVAFLAIFGTRIYFSHHSTPEYLHRTFQQKCLSAGAELKQTTEYLATGFDTVSPWLFDVPPDFGRASSGEASFFIFKGDSIIFWTDSKAALPENISGLLMKTDQSCRLKNGWYLFHGDQKGSYRFLGGILIKSESPVLNEYIGNQFTARFGLPETISLTSQKGPYPVYSESGKYLFSLDFGNYQPGSAGMFRIALILFIAGMVFLLLFLYRTCAAAAWFRQRPDRLVFCFSILVFLLRWIQHAAGFPKEIYSSGLFGPAWYSSSSMLPSLGDFTLNVFLLFIVSLVFYRHWSFPNGRETTQRHERILIRIILLAILIGLFHATGYLINNLVINSTVSLDLQNIAGLSAASGFGLTVLTFLFLSLWLVSSRLLDHLHENSPWWRESLFALLGGILFSLVLYAFNRDPDPAVTAIFLVYFLVYGILKARKTSGLPVQNLLFFICFFSFFAVFLLNRSNQEREKEMLNLMAGKLATQRNPVTEVMWEQLERRIISDKALAEWLQAAEPAGHPGTDSLMQYIRENYFNDFWKKYQIQVTYCDSSKELRIQPQGYLVNCNKYFRGIIDNYGEETQFPGLFFMDYGLGKEYYLAVLPAKPFRDSGNGRRAIFIEFFLKNAYPDPGYPGLLMDRTRMEPVLLNDYSYGYYKNGRLIRASGSTGYKAELLNYDDYSATRESFRDNKTVHFVYRVNAADTLLVSKRKGNLLSIAAPFSYLFILFSAISFIFIGIASFPKTLVLFSSSLRNRLHLLFTGILLLTMTAIGIVQSVNIIQINTAKNTENLRERTWSVGIEIQHKFGRVQDIAGVPAGELEDFLVKLSNVFFTDINVYDEKGMLAASSRPQIFEEGLLSGRMNAEAYKKLALDEDAMLIHEESIGKMKFSSAYQPFYNEQDHLLGFINLPYFARQDESKKEISSFLVTFFNVYILLIILGVLITVLISNYFTKPLAMLAGKLSKLRLGGVNEKISWVQHDEIGELVDEYNRMIDELARSAEKLAKSERESAWREMARQVAHEIKNPLTPMKLSAQYLEKAWKEKAPDWNERLARFTKTLIGQIDALSVIATDFSDFARMPAVILMETDPAEAIRFALSTYQDIPGIHVEFKPSEAGLLIMGDRSQMIRLFTNLLNNALQAIGDRTDGMIGITIVRVGLRVVISVSDNGCGIPADRRDKIFLPDFTTRTGGMGLGLAIAKGIVEGMNGTITFDSAEGRGTVFNIEFPLYETKEIRRQD